MSAAITRFRIAAYVVGCFLIALVVVTMPLKYLAQIPEPAAIISPIHGFCYMVYVVLTFDLGRRSGWPLGRTIGYMLGGTVPFVSFYVERRAVASAVEPVAA
ncbi:DUF3817 domain-containing protein [Longispora albida]|uniref:DUF3817 domain-containing protein n=1 Tax=Longispora albida TaxID=203523 RepID=UPI000381C2E5|nr:DUF3817 domain-containing protein [Longispora albida]